MGRTKQILEINQKDFYTKTKSTIKNGLHLYNWTGKNELSKHLEISAIITAICVFFWTIIIYIFFSINTEQAIPYLIINQGFMYFFVLFAVGQSTMTKVIRTDQYGK